jgi:hypothetical protein
VFSGQIVFKRIETENQSFLVNESRSEVSLAKGIESPLIKAQ